MSADTITPSYTNPQDLNRYSYVLNNPLRYTDPTGNRACGDGEDVDCSGHKQDPLKNPHVPKPPKPHKDQSGGDDKPLFAPSEINSNDTVQWCEPLDCVLSGVGFASSVGTFLPPPCDLVSTGADVVVTLWSIGRTEEDYSQGKISNTRRWILNGTGLVGLAPAWLGPPSGFIGAGASFFNLLVTATGIPN